MPKFIVKVSKDWTEYGEVLITAESEDEAREEAQEMLTDGDDRIMWEPNMEPGAEHVEGCEEAT